MRKLLILILLIAVQQVFAQGKHIIKSPKVDKRVELLSIVFKLAGNKEYDKVIVKDYANKVDEHFSPFNNHKVVSFAKELRQNKGISYDAVASMAIVLNDELNPLIDFSKTLPEKRWSEDDATKFVKLLKDFYKDTECEKFFEESEPLFREVEKRFSYVYDKIDLKWYQNFFGTNAEEDFNLIVSLGCGNHNYGPSYTLTNEKKKVFSVMGTWRTDGTGMSIYKEAEYLPIIVHEFAHSFVNPLNEKYISEFEQSGKEIYKAIEYEMSHQQAYGNWEIILNEALVRASVIKYFIDHGEDESKIQMMLNNESNKGFIWIKGLVAELKTFDNDRDKYPTLENYIPNLAVAYKSFAEKITHFDSQRPKVQTISEFNNNDTNVDSKIKTITINFDRTLAGKGYSVNYGSKGKFAFPKLDNIYYSDDNKSVVMEVQLQPDKEYQLVLTGKNFKTEQGIPLKTYEVNFKTK
uniref:DUF4932 domain-containing protein n=1 Tax=uncultured Draconibacterium sp. TaxID=1573823 RepID=UPI0032175E2C